MDPRRFELLTSCMPCRHSNQLNYGPLITLFLFFRKLLFLLIFYVNFLFNISQNIELSTGCFLCPRQELNLELRLRRSLFYPLNYEGYFMGFKIFFLYFRTVPFYINYYSTIILLYYCAIAL